MVDMTGWSFELRAAGRTAVTSGSVATAARMRRTAVTQES
jgi:hypothetical protein